MVIQALLLRCNGVALVAVGLRLLMYIFRQTHAE